MEPYLRMNFGADQAGRWNLSEIVSQITRQIKDKPSFDGCRLPPVRVLAHQLGVSKNTVQSAYEELKSKGLVESKDRKGLFVQMADQSVGEVGCGAVPSPEMREIPNIKMFRKPRGTKDPFLNLSAVFIDPRLLPKEKLSDCFRSVLKTPGLVNFPDLQGFFPLREKIAQRLRKRGIKAHADHVVITNGSQQALDLVCRSLSSKTVATENPSYYLGKALFEMNGINVVGLPIQPFEGVDLRKWEKIISESKPGLVYLTSSYQNPTGYSYSSREMAKIIEWSLKYGFGLMEDDWGSEMLSFSEFRPSLRALGGENVLYMNSFTKKLLPSLRIGYLLGNEATVQSFVNCKRVSTLGVPSIVEAVLFEFLDRGYYDSHLKKVQAELDVRYRDCLELLRTLMPEEIKWTSPGGGPSLWLELPERVSIDKLVANLEKKKIIVQPSDQAFMGPLHLHGFKVGYAYLSKKEMQKAIEFLAQELKDQLKCR